MIVLADSDRAFHSRVSEQLGRGDDLLFATDLPQLGKILADRAGSIDVLMLGPNLPHEDALRLTQQLQSSAPEISVVFVAGTLGSELLQKALRAGVRDVLPDSFTPEQLRETVERAEMLSKQMRGRTGVVAEVDHSADDHRIITVFSSKGGCGKSFIASNLAILLAQKTGKEVAMVDLDLQFGDLAIMLQLFPARTIYDAAQSLDRLDPEALKGYLTPHRQGVYLLAAPLEPGLSETITADQVQRIMKMLKQSFSYVIVDSPPSFTDHVLGALDESDECALVTSMDVPSIKNLKLALQTLELLGFGRDRIRLILNRADAKVGLRVQEVEKTLGTSIDVAIPSMRDVPLSINRGTPLVTEDPKSPVVASIAKLAELIGTPATSPRIRQGSGRRLFGRG